MNITATNFRALAAALASTRPPLDAPLAAQHQWHIDRQAVLEACASSNPGFDSDRFIAATLIAESAQ